MYPAPPVTSTWRIVCLRISPLGQISPSPRPGSTSRIFAGPHTIGVVRRFVTIRLASNAMVALAFAGGAASLPAADPEAVRVGGAEIEVWLGPPEPSVPRTAVLAWVKRCATAVSSYFGRFPVDRVRLNLIT